MIMQLSLIATALLAKCRVEQSLFSTRFEETDDVIGGSIECFETLSRAAVDEEYKEHLRSSEKEQLVADLTEFLCYLNYDNETVSDDTADKVEEIVNSCYVLQSDENVSEQERKTGMLALWKELASLQDSMQLREAEFSRVPARELRFFPGMVSLAMNFDNLTDEDTETIESLCFLEELSYLSLQETHLTVMPCFNRFKKLCIAELRSSKISCLNAERYKDGNGIIVPCLGITHVYFDDSLVSEIEEEFFQTFPNLRMLGLANTKITDISMFNDAFFERHSNVRMILVKGCNIKKFSKNISKENKRRFVSLRWE